MHRPMLALVVLPLLMSGCSWPATTPTITPAPSAAPATPEEAPALTGPGFSSPLGRTDCIAQGDGISCATDSETAEGGRIVYELGASGEATSIQMDPNRGADVPVLPIGGAYEYGAISCHRTAEATICRNGDGHGFTLGGVKLQTIQ